MVYRNYGITLYIDSLEEALGKHPKDFIKHYEINFPASVSPSSAFDKKRIRKIRRLINSSNVKLSFHLPHSFNISDIIPAIRNKGLAFLSESIETAGKIGVYHITIHMGTFYWFPSARWTRKKALDRFIVNIYPLLQLCKTNRIKIALENVAPIPQGSDYYYLGDNINDFRYIFSKLDSKYLGFCLDTGHANLGEGITEYIKHLGDKIINIHFHDNNGANDEHLPVGGGTINWQDLTTQLIKMKYKGPLISECRDNEKYHSVESIDKFFENVLANSG